MWKFRWAHKRSPRRKIRGVYDCVRTMERIRDRICVLHNEVQQLTKDPTTEDHVILARRIQVRVERLMDHAHRVRDIQRAWAGG